MLLTTHHHHRNMFLAAAPYFQTRFESNEWILANSQSAILSVSTTANLLALLVLMNIQSSANYPLRIKASLIVTIAVFGLLTISAVAFRHVSATTYLVFLLLMVGASAWAAGMMQNGAFAFAASFGRPEYTQAIMAGQGVAGILPPLAQMVSYLAVPQSDNSNPSQNSTTTTTTTTTTGYALLLLLSDPTSTRRTQTSRPSSPTPRCLQPRIHVDGMLQMSPGMSLPQLLGLPCATTC